MSLLFFLSSSQLAPPPTFSSLYENKHTLANDDRDQYTHFLFPKGSPEAPCDLVEFKSSSADFFGFCPCLLWPPWGYYSNKEKIKQTNKKI